MSVHVKLSLSAVSCDLIEFLSNPELDLGGLDEALLLHGELARVLGDCHHGAGLVAELPGDQAHPQGLHEVLKVLTVCQLVFTSARRHDVPWLERTRHD